MKACRTTRRSTWGCEDLPEPQIAAREVTDRRAAHQFHVPLDFAADQAESTFHAGLTGRGQRKEIIAAHPDGLGANRERLQHAAPALDAAIHKHVDPIAYGINNLRQLVK